MKSIEFVIGIDLIALTFIAGYFLGAWEEYCRDKKEREK